MKWGAEHEVRWVILASFGHVLEHGNGDGSIQRSVAMPLCDFYATGGMSVAKSADDVEQSISGICGVPRRPTSALQVSNENLVFIARKERFYAGQRFPTPFRRQYSDVIWI
jgi:hypothetical protein